MNNFSSSKLLSYASLAIGCSFLIQLPAYALSDSTSSGPSTVSNLISEHELSESETLFTSNSIFFMILKGGYAPPDEGAGSGEPDRTEGSGTR